MPSASSRSRLAARIRSCSGRSESAAASAGPVALGRVSLTRLTLVFQLPGNVIRPDQYADPMSYGQNPYGQPPYGANPPGQQPGHYPPGPPAGPNPGAGGFGAPPSQPGQPGYGQPYPAPPGQQQYPGQQHQPPGRYPGRQPGEYPGGPGSVDGAASPSSAAQYPPDRVQEAVAIATHAVPVHTLDDEPLMFVTEALGEVLGVATRPAVVDPTALAKIHQHAVAAMAKMAKDAGADGVIGLRFTLGADAVVAYGTAVRMEVDEAEDDGSAAPSMVAREPGDDLPGMPDDDTARGSGSFGSASSPSFGSGSFGGGYANPRP